MFRKAKNTVLEDIACRLVTQDIGTLVLDVRGVCLREKFESSVKVGEKVSCRLEENAKAKLGHCLAIHGRDGEIVGRVAAEQGDVLVPFMKDGKFALYHW